MIVRIMGALDVLAHQRHIPHGRPHRRHAASLEVRCRGRRTQQARHSGQVRSQQTGAVVQSPSVRQLVRRSGDLVLADVVRTTGPHHNVVPLVDPCAGDTERLQGACNHQCMLVAVEAGRRNVHAPVGIAGVVVHRAATGAAADQLHVAERRCLWNTCGPCPCRQLVEVHLGPGVLVAADDDARRIAVQQQQAALRVRTLKEPVLNGQVGIRIAADRVHNMHNRLGLFLVRRLADAVEQSVELAGAGGQPSWC
ncbi:uncharacterized protein SPSK_00325 [Sporothrix schenckii 1099-18]|uniref:Uncharacterized protein n=1 Tax=Sporothrix schenckii 1099-18 TaxID=1397361 RepID=A0A0F2M4L6_SPOSC|nr:uncharacterized protein SPSK_00325 [Sporothrix schenckii 1099-18]KJR84029.1 hypothetical protein SPSK_00325 [Sporothrix schenckii 1099-18]